MIADFLIDPRFQGSPRIFVLLFENETERKLQITHYYSKVEIKYCNRMIDEKMQKIEKYSNWLI